jgi:hypothetical protein
MRTQLAIRVRVPGYAELEKQARARRAEVTPAGQAETRTTPRRGFAGILIVAALILLLIARTKGQSLSNRHIFEPLRPLATAAPSAAAPAVAAPSLAHAPSPASFEGVPAVSAGDLIEPLAFLLRRYLKYPALGHPVLDELVGNLRNTARGTADEAVERAANLLRYGDRRQLFMLLGGAAFAGWVLARQSPDERLHDATPVG